MMFGIKTKTEREVDALKDDIVKLRVINNILRKTIENNHENIVRIVHKLTYPDSEFGLLDELLKIVPFRIDFDKR